VPDHPNPDTDLPPVSGAWRPGDDAGRRRFATVVDGRPFRLEGGGVLRHVEVAYETWGELAADRSNAVLVCHALTGDSHAAGRAGPGHREAGWWDEMVGPGRGIDPDHWFVVCANVLGGCQGTTGPSSVDPDTNRPYGSSFPVVTIRDMVRVQALLADHLGIGRWRAVVGGSMGGMQALEWATMFPDRVAAAVAIATSAQASAQQIAWSMVGRRAVQLDPGFCGGDYYDQPPGAGPHRGLALARQIAQIHYRSEAVFADRFGRTLLDPLDAAGSFALDQRFDVEGYLDYHGQKLVRRFDANTYLRLNKAMDLHDLGRGRGGVAAALARVSAPVLVMSIRSDMLYPPYQQEELRDELRGTGTRVGFYEIDSADGHDGFLLEAAQISPLVAGFLDGAETDAPAPDIERRSVL
jgi:homoserine O-acetyltransferase